MVTMVGHKFVAILFSRRGRFSKLAIALAILIAIEVAPSRGKDSVTLFALIEMLIAWCPRGQPHWKCGRLRQQRRISQRAEKDNPRQSEQATPR